MKRWRVSLVRRCTAVIVFLATFGWHESAPGAAANTSPAPVALPGPPYPAEAEDKGVQGTVTISVHFDGNGQADVCNIVRSSGSSLLDKSTVSFIRQHWKNHQMAGQTIETPIAYRIKPGASIGTGAAMKGSFENVLIKQGFTYGKVSAVRTNQNRIVVEINGKPLNLLIDTGAAFTLLTKEAARRAHITANPRIKINFAALNGAVPGLILNVTSLKIGGTDTNPAPVFVGGFAVSDFDGVLGMATLRANHAVFLVNPPALFINPVRPATSALGDWLRANGSVEVPLERMGLLYTTAVKLNGIPARLLLDSGAEFSLINEDFIEKNNFSLLNEGAVLSGADGHLMIARPVRLKQVEVGDFPCGPETLSEGNSVSLGSKDSKYPVNGALGFDVLGGQITVINTSADRAYFRRIRH